MTKRRLERAASFNSNEKSNPSAWFTLVRRKPTGSGNKSARPLVAGGRAAASNVGLGSNALGLCCKASSATERQLFNGRWSVPSSRRRTIGIIFLAENDVGRAFFDLCQGTCSRPFLQWMIEGESACRQNSRRFAARSSSPAFAVIFDHLRWRRSIGRHDPLGGLWLSARTTAKG
jgi:hypothetical protein